MKMMRRAQIVGTIIAAFLIALAFSAPATAQFRNDRSIAIEIIKAWQGARRLPNPAARAQAIGRAIQLAERANPWPMKRPSRSQLLAQMYGQLGNEYRRIRGLNAHANLQRALTAYDRALQFMQRRRGPNWARIKVGIARTKLDLRQGNRTENVEQAIAAFRDAQTVFTKTARPDLWADIQVRLSRAFWYRNTGRRGENLEEAIALADSALQIFSREKSPRDWASAQSALGAAYWARLNGSRADNIEKAIAAYEQALVVTPREKHPGSWAGLQDNIAMAYAERRRGHVQDNLALSAQSFENAAAIFTRERYPAKWAQINMNYANLLLENNMAGRAAQRIEAAITRYKNALSVYSPRRFPERRARVSVNLGLAFLQRRAGRPGQDLDNAIAAFRDALQYYTPASDLEKWAVAQNNLGVALRRRRSGNRARNLENAFRAHEAVLTVLSPSQLPRQHMRAALASGHIESARGRWKSAGDYYRSAMATSEILFGLGLNRAEAKGEIGDATDLFDSAAFAAIQRNELKQALSILDSGRARLLRAAMGLNALKLSPERRKLLDQTRAKIQRLEQSIVRYAGRERRNAVEKLEALRSSIAKILAGQANTHLQQNLAATSVPVLMTHYDAIAVPVITRYGASLILATNGASGPQLSAVKLGQVTTQNLDRVLHGGREGGKFDGWLKAYTINNLPEREKIAHRARWLRAINGIGAQLNQLVAQALVDELKRRDLKAGASVLWLPQGGLGLLPIAAAGGAEGMMLLDKFALSTAPSLTAAADAVRQVRRPRRDISLTAIVNPTEDLQFTEPEGRAAASFFRRTHRRVFGPTNAERDAVIASLRTSSHWHFATHGKFSWDDPEASALLLSGGDQLTIRNVFGRGRIGRPRLVVLSACETGLYDFQRTPNEFIGLPAAFMEAGAAGVVGSLWPVDDTSTALLMMRFYALHFGERMRPAQALRRAQIWLRDSTHADFLAFASDMVAMGRITRRDQDRINQALKNLSGRTVPFRHPFYWAAFMFYGA